MGRDARLSVPAPQGGGANNAAGPFAAAPDGRNVEAKSTITVTRPPQARVPPRPVPPSGPVAPPAPVASPPPPKRSGAEAELVLELADGVKLEMVALPAGEFLMGSRESDNSHEADEIPQHKVRITRQFYLGKYPVTQEQWQAVMGSHPSRFQGPTNPVEQVSWTDAQRFLETLNAKFAGKGSFTLPTEAQWEYACRAGSTTRFCFGDGEEGLDHYAWYDRNSAGQTQPVGGKAPNAWGLYDMHGNVWQWCADRYHERYYGKSPDADPMGPEMGPNRVLRGGGCSAAARSCRSAIRAGAYPGYRSSDLGFRIALLPIDRSESRLAATALRLEPVAPQTVEAGKRLRVPVTVEDAEIWQGSVEYGLVGPVPPGATIDPRSGEFSWVPPAARTCTVTVSVRARTGAATKQRSRLPWRGPSAPSTSSARATSRSPSPWPLAWIWRWS